MSGDRRPVSPTELQTLEHLAGRPLPTFLFARHNFFFFAEAALLRLTVNDGEVQVARDWLHELDDADADVFTEAYRVAQWNRCLRANQDALASMEEEAINFIRQIAESYPNRARFISFSGGKDSALVAVLVNKALGPTPLLFSDTTIEYPPTYEYIVRFGEYLGVQLHWQRAQKSFLELCDVLDPPSRIMRWCCTVCKSQPINAFYSTMGHKILNFDGVRRAESGRRARYPRVYQVPKYAREITARPILDWPTFAVWAYIEANGIPSNPLYDLGFSRIGCMYCQSNRGYNEYLTQKHFPDLYSRWHQYLLAYAMREGKPSPEDYVACGHWKVRNIRREKSYVIQRTESCVHEGGYSYEFSRPITEELVEFLKPLGKVATFVVSGKTCFTVGCQNPFLISGVVGDLKVDVSFVAGGNTDRLVRSRIERQIEKYLNCVKCGGCLGVCPVGAISMEGGMLTVDDQKCTRCGKCTTTVYLDRACVALGYRGTKQAIRRE
jgi:phosphoadenosine phosphosulfate reductase